MHRRGEGQRLDHLDRRLSPFLDWGWTFRVQEATLENIIENGQVYRELYRVSICFLSGQQSLNFHPVLLKLVYDLPPLGP